MVTDLRLGTEIVVCPIVREPDGLALSSRNAYLSADERRQALVLSRAIRQVEELAAQGERRASPLIAAARAIFAAEPQSAWTTLSWWTGPRCCRWKLRRSGTLFAVAAWVGATRLIDNTILA